MIKNQRVKKFGKGMIKVSGLSHKREKKSNTSMDRLMFQNICLIYHDINNKYARNSVILLTVMTNNIQVKINKYEDLQGKAEK